VEGEEEEYVTRGDNDFDFITLEVDVDEMDKYGETF